MNKISYRTKQIAVKKCSEHVTIEKPQVPFI